MHASNKALRLFRPNSLLVQLAKSTVVAPAFAAKNFRHLAGTKAKARWNATAADAPKEPTATHGAAAAKWDPRRVGYYRARFQEETACLRAAARRSA